MAALAALLQRMNEVFDGDPWYGKSVMNILADTDPANVFIKPTGTAHSAIELLYHMINWEEFALHQLEGTVKDPARYELSDWRAIDPHQHTWSAAIAEYAGAHQQIVKILSASGDDVLDKEVKFRNYNMRFLLDGLIDHNIYHAGQLASLQKILIR